MLDELFEIHHEVMSTVPDRARRYLYEQIRWEGQAICIVGSRGVGKTTMMCQALLEQYGSVEKALYISADNINVLANGLFGIAQEYFKYGGEAIFIDEVHKYPDWSLEIKNIIDTYKRKKIIFSASSALELNKSKYDLSRRVVYYELKGLSFREYLYFAHNMEFDSYALQDIFKNHAKLAGKFKDITVLKHFQDYLKFGYYPFFLEGVGDVSHKINNVIEKVIFEDVAVVYNLKQSTLTVLKKLIWLVATSKGLAPVVDNISKNLGASREVVYQSFEYLEHAGILINTYPQAQGMKLVRKPGKSYMDNSNLLYAICGNLRLESDLGNIRETFFVNQLQPDYGLHLHDHGDFILDDGIVVEVGGRSKDFRQVKGQNNAYLAVDGIEIGAGKKIPLYLFGFLY